MNAGNVAENNTMRKSPLDTGILEHNIANIEVFNKFSFGGLGRRMSVFKRRIESSTRNSDNIDEEHLVKTCKLQVVFRW